MRGLLLAFLATISTGPAGVSRARSAKTTAKTTAKAV